MKIKPLKNIGIVYFVISAFIFTISILGPDVSAIDIPHIVLNKVTPTTVVCVLSIGVIVMGILTQKTTIDILTILLVIRVSIELVPALHISDMPDFYGNLETSILCVLTYFIAKNYVEKTKNIKMVITAFFFWICVQVILESFLGPVSFFADTYIYKNDLIIPIGGSNAIATKIISCFAFSFCICNRKYSKILLTVLMFLTLGLTKSRSGLLAGIIILAIVCVWNGHISLKRILQLALLLLFGGIGFIFFLKKSSVGQYVFYNNSSTVLNRLERWKISINLFWKYPLFGSGFLVQHADYNPHNWIISIISRGGIIGAIIALIIIVFITNKLRGKYGDEIIRGCMCFIIAVLIQGFSEITLFTSTNDFFFWFIVGIAMKESKIYKNVLGIEEKAYEKKYFR